MCICHLFYCYDKILNKGNITEAGLSWLAVLGDTVCHDREIWWCEQQRADHSVFSQKADGAKWYHSVFFFFFFYSFWAAAHGMLLSTPKAFPLQLCLFRGTPWQAYRSVSWAILNPVKLKIKINHHAIQTKWYIPLRIRKITDLRAIHLKYKFWDVRTESQINLRILPVCVIWVSGCSGHVIYLINNFHQSHSPILSGISNLMNSYHNSTA